MNRILSLYYKVMHAPTHQYHHPCLFHNTNITTVYLSIPVDKDGKISLDDFRGMLAFNEANPPPFG
jgi:hypothetical protein